MVNAFKSGAVFLTSPYHPIDLRTYYLASKSFFKNQNPYTDSAQSVTWEETSQTERKTWHKKTGFPHATVVYAPQFPWFFSIYSFLDFTTAKWFQFALNFLALCCIVFYLKKLAAGIPYHIIILSLMAFRGTWYAVESGQPMLQVLAVCLLSLYLVEKKNLSFLPALLLAFVSFKFTLLIPFVIYLACLRHFRTISIYIFLVLIFNTLALIFTQDPNALIASWQDNISRLWNYTHSHDEMNSLKTISTSISVCLNYFLDIPAAAIKAMNLFFLVTGYVLAVYTGIKKSARGGMLIACLTGLCFGHHLLYDLMAFVCFLVMARDGKSVNNILFYVLAILLMIPLGTFANLFNMQELNFAAPICLLAYFVFITQYYLRNKNRAIKNPS